MQVRLIDFSWVKMMKYRITVLNELKEHIIDQEIDTLDEKWLPSGGIIAILPKKPFLCGGIVIEPDPEIQKPSFKDVPEEIKEKILADYRKGVYRV